MNPDIDLRLQSMLKALTDVILPAIPAEQSLARDQTKLVMGHLTVLAAHWKHALNYELESLRLARALAAELSDMAMASGLRDELNAAVTATETLDRSNYDEVSAAYRALKQIITCFIAGDDSGTLMPLALKNAVLRYSTVQARRERIWHQGAGLDPDLATLPPIASLFTQQAG
jgi:hypothetical protein